MKIYEVGKKLIVVILASIVSISCTTKIHFQKLNNCLTSKEIKYIFESEYKLSLRYALRDKIYYTPSIKNLFNDYELAKINIADDFNMPVDALSNLYSYSKDGEASIWDCDNMVRELKEALDKIHYKRYLKKEHSIIYEYASFPVTIEVGQDGTLHTFLMIFTEEREIYFIDFPNPPWSINEWKPSLIHVG